MSRVLEGGGRPNLDGFPTGLQHILRQSWAALLSERWSMAQVVAALEAYIGSEGSQQAVTQGVKQAPMEARVIKLDSVGEQHKEANQVLAGAA